jgi:hypothetical protein
MAGSETVWIQTAHFSRNALQVLVVFQFQPDAKTKYEFAGEDQDDLVVLIQVVEEVYKDIQWNA